MNFSDRLRRSLYLQKPLETDELPSLSDEIVSRRVLARRKITPDLYRFERNGDGKVDIYGQKIRLRARVVKDEWAESQKPDGDYCNFGSIGVSITLDGAELSEYNRVYLRVFPRFDGGRAPNMTVRLSGVGETPDDGMPLSASHEVNLDNFKENTVIWEIPDLHRARVRELCIDFPLNGMDTACSEFAEYDILETAFERAEKTEKFLGWDIDGDSVAVSSVYLSDGRKTALSSSGGDIFTVFKSGRPCLVKEPRRVCSSLGEYFELDFSNLREPGDYHIEFGKAKSAGFRIADGFDELKWKLLNFIFSERCGYPVAGKHGACHSDITAVHDGRRMSYNGGWHDAGDLSQQTLQTGEIAAALSDCARNIGGDLSRRLELESEWGLEFVLRTRFGDGYRASSAGATRWTNGLTGDMDDIFARVHNQAFQNYLLAACEASCGTEGSFGDRAFTYKLREAAAEDFAFAEERFAVFGVEKPVVFEHFYNSSLSLYHAAAALAAGKLAQAFQTDAAKTRDYGRAAGAHLAYLLECQENEGPLSGYFCRDNSRKTPVHFNHQSREHLFADAIITALEAFPSDPRREAWEKAAANYGEYLKKIAAYTSPFGMLPSGVYYESEALDRESFELLHLFTDYDANKAALGEQIRGGVKLGEGRYLKRFPAWFAFRGNFAVCLSSAAAARRIAAYTRDRELSDIADEAVYWILGKNPFCRSFVYGEGERCSALYAPLLGETVGEIPVGIKTAGNGDEPYMPTTADATYAEVWTSSAARLLMALR